MQHPDLAYGNARGFRVAANPVKCLVSISFAVLAARGFAAAEVPPEDFSCDEGTVIESAVYFVQCSARAHSEYVPESANWNYPAGWVIPWPIPKTKMKVVMSFGGFGGYELGSEPYPTGLTADDSAPNSIVAKQVWEYYPSQALFAVNGIEPLGWGGIYEGENSNGWRFSATITEIAKRGYPIDWGAGITMQGHCYGGAAVVTQSLILPDESWRHAISVVDAELGTTLFVNPPAGNYYRDPAVQLAWNGYDIRNADFLLPENQQKVKHIYYRLVGSSFPADDIVGFDQRFFSEVCDAGHIACFGMWGRMGHAWPDPEAPPAYQAVMDRLYSGPHMVVRRDRMLPVFTRSTANWWGERGHYNLGLEWSNAGFIDTASQVAVPIRYRRHTAMGPDIPDQPTSAQFDLTIRRINKFSAQVGDVIHYSIGAQVGDVVVTASGEVTIPNITLASSLDYTTVVITRASL